MSCKHTRQCIQDICKKSTVLTKKYRENNLLSINIVIDDKTYIQCEQSIHVHRFGGKYLCTCIPNNHGSFNLIISKQIIFLPHLKGYHKIQILTAM